jgi:hypothetical protein
VRHMVVKEPDIRIHCPKPTGMIGLDPDIDKLTMEVGSLFITESAYAMTSESTPWRCRGPRPKSCRKFASSPHPGRCPLSVLDAIALQFSSTPMIWVYNPPTTAQETKALTSCLLAASLSRTLDVYAPWSSQLHLSEYDPASRAHTSRFRRLQLTYGTASDPAFPLLSHAVDSTSHHSCPISLRG